MNQQKFHDIMRDELDIYYMSEARPTAKGFIRKVDLELSDIANRYGLPDTDKLTFFKYVKAKEADITARLTNLLNQLKKISR